MRHHPLSIIYFRDMQSRGDLTPLLSEDAWKMLSAEYKSEITPPKNIISFRNETRKIVSG